MDIEVHEVAQSRRQTLVDTRPRSERFGDLGFIPGSRWFPQDALKADPRSFQREIPTDRVIVLACLTGRRSVLLVPVVRSLGYAEVYNLKGGLLAWAAAHPVCQIQPRSPAHGLQQPISTDDLTRKIASCFVAESVENTLRQGLEMSEFNPKAVVDDLVKQAFRRHDDPHDALLEVLERLSEIAYRRGHPLDTIARNVDRLLAMVEDVV